MKRSIRLIKDERGAALVEFAIICVLLVTLAMGICDFGLVFRDYLAMSQITREAARSAAVGKTPAEINAVINTWISNLGLKSSAVTVKEMKYYTAASTTGVTLGTAGNGYNDAPVNSRIEVKMAYNHSMVTGLFGSSKLLKSSMVMRRE